MASQSTTPIEATKRRSRAAPGSQNAANQTAAASGTQNKPQKKLTAKDAAEARQTAVRDLVSQLGNHVAKLELQEFATKRKNWPQYSRTTTGRNVRSTIAHLDRVVDAFRSATDLLESAKLGSSAQEKRHRVSLSDLERASKKLSNLDANSPYTSQAKELLVKIENLAGEINLSPADAAAGEISILIQNVATSSDLHFVVEYGRARTRIARAQILGEIADPNEINQLATKLNTVHKARNCLILLHADVDQGDWEQYDRSFAELEQAHSSLASMNIVVDRASPAELKLLRDTADCFKRAITAATKVRETIDGKSLGKSNDTTHTVLAQTITLELEAVTQKQAVYASRYNFYTSHKVHDAARIADAHRNRATALLEVLGKAQNLLASCS